MEFIRSLSLVQKRIIAATLGTISGYLYYHYIGCMSGTCAITSNPYISTIYGGVLGMLLVPSPKRESTPASDPGEATNESTNVKDGK